MASFNTVGIEAMMQEISRMSDKAVEKIPKMLKAGAAVLVEAQKEEAKFLDIKDTGEFIGSIKATKIKTDEENGTQYIEVYPHGTDNAEKGFIAEYGRTGDKSRTKPNRRSKKYKYGIVPPRPWMSTANIKSADAVVEAQRKVWEDDGDG